MMFDNIVGNLQELAKGIQAIPELTDIQKKIDSMIKNVDAPLLIMVMGEFSTGKSTFINALVEKEVTIVDAKPTTAVITKLCYGLEDRITVYFLDGSQKDYKTEDFASLTVEDATTTDLRSNINYVERVMPVEMLKSMTIIDSPGLNSLEKSHEETTHQFMDKADTVIWLFDANNSCKQSEIDAMKRLNPRLSPLVLVNKMDMLDEDEGDSPEKTLSDVRRKLSNNRLEVQDIIGVSSKLAFLGKQRSNEKFLDKSNFEEFYHKLETVILPRRDTYKQNALFDDLADVLFHVGTVVSNKKSENDKQKDIDYGAYIETAETLALTADALENVVNAFLELFELSRDGFSDEQVNKKKLNASVRTVFGTLYWLGLVTEKNTELAEKHLEAAAVRNDEVSQKILMNIYTALGQDAKAEYWGKRLGIHEKPSLLQKTIPAEKSVQGNQHPVKRRKDFILKKEDIFLERMTVIEPERAIPGSLPIPGEDDLAEDGTSVLLPIQQKILEYFSPEEIARSISLENREEDIRVTFSPLISGHHSKKGALTFSKSYSKRDLIYLYTNVSVIEIWPNFRRADWKKYYLYYENSEAQNEGNPEIGKDFFFVYPSSGCGENLPPKGLANRYTAKLNEFPEVLLCMVNLSSEGRDEGGAVYAGMILLSPPEKSPSRIRGKNWDITIAIDTEKISLSYSGKENPSRRLRLQSHLFQVTDSGLMRNQTFLNFIPSMMNEYTPSIYHNLQNYTEGAQIRPLLDGNIFFLLKITEVCRSEVHRLSYLDWQRLEPRPMISAYMEQICLQCAVEAVLDGVDTICWNFLLPSGLEEPDTFHDVCRKAVSNACRDTGIVFSPEKDLVFS